MPSAANRPVAGILWMLVTGLCFVALTIIVKHVGSTLPAAQSAFLRYLLGLVFLIPMIRPMIEAQMTKRQLWLFSARGAAHTVGVTLWFYAMTQITIAEVVAMNYVNPIYVTLGAALFLGERLATRRIIAICVAFAGAIIILRPGFRELGPGHLAMVFTAIFLGASYLLAKLMSGEVRPIVVVGMLSVTVTIGLAPLAWAVWVPPTWADIGWLFLVACFATAGHYTMTRAFEAAPVAVTQPVTFLQLVWGVLAGAVFFAEAIDIWVVIGGTIAMAAVSFIAWREYTLKRAEVTPVTHATKV
ncbi:MAG: DMT family transporter [Pseudomonadota bacterium]